MDGTERVQPHSRYYLIALSIFAIGLGLTAYSVVSGIRRIRENMVRMDVPGQMDLELKRWLEQWGRPYIAVATKIDKLKTQHDRVQSMVALREGNPSQAPLTFSAETGQGVREIWQAITNIRTNP